jgi:hypothetical protein
MGIHLTEVHPLSISRTPPSALASASNLPFQRHEPQVPRTFFRITSLNAAGAAKTLECMFHDSPQDIQHMCMLVWCWQARFDCMIYCKLHLNFGPTRFTPTIIAYNVKYNVCLDVRSDQRDDHHCLRN